VQKKCFSLGKWAGYRLRFGRGGGEECSCSIGVCEKVITIGVEFWGVREGIGVCHLSVSSSLLQDA
jgi:hypothetical protein